MLQSPEDRELQQKIRKRFDGAESRYHRKFRTKCDSHYSLYRNYDQLRDALRTANSIDQRRDILGDASDVFGATLFIPFIFSTIEQMVPRIVAKAPRPRLRPLNKESVGAIPAVSGLLYTQMQQMKYALGLQDTVKSGLTYGLGVRKVGWLRSTRDGTKRIRIGDGWGETSASLTVYDDPYAENVDPRDFIWDGNAIDTRTLEWAIHRTWRSTEYVKAKFDCGDWHLPSGVMIEEVLNRRGAQAFQEVYQDRSRHNGHSLGLETDIHEVWEYHDGAEVAVVLDREVPVSVRSNPHWHKEIPFTLYRPIRLGNELMGMSVVEALEDLQVEINTLRRQRRDAASRAIDPPFLFQIGRVDPAHIVWGARTAIPVNGNPSDILQQMRVNDVPASSYQEENNLRDDIQRTAGMLDITGQGSSQTATGVQLVYQEASARISNMVFNVENETIADDIRLIYQMNAQNIIERQVMAPQIPTPGQPDSVWTNLTVNPEVLQGKFVFTVESGSTAMDNVPQMRADAGMWGQLLQNPFVDKQMVTRRMLTCLGEEDPEVFMAPQEQMPAQALDQVGHQLEQSGQDPGQVQQIIDQVRSDNMPQAAMNGASQE